MGELFASFGLAMLTGVLCIYIVLVLLFKDFIQPATILIALVLSIPGAFLALFVTHTAVSMPSMIGLIMLMGIATKNSILLIDYVILARRDHGMNRWDALLDACQKRARPIVMTTIAMGCRYVANCHRTRYRPQFPCADGDCGDWRVDYLDLPEPAGDSGGLHLCR
jgi:multidrug efflux pump subunit AcrB